MDRLQKITLGGKLDIDGIWRWYDGAEKEELEKAGTRMVVFGDNWVANGKTVGMGTSWTEVLCAEVRLFRVK